MSDTSLDSTDRNDEESELEIESADTVGIMFDDKVYNEDQVSKWVVEKVVEISNLNNGKGIMCTLKANKGLQPSCTHVRLNLEACTKHFAAKLVQRLDENESESNQVVTFAEESNDDNKFLKEMLMKEGWSRKIRECRCKHDVSAGWKVHDQPSYFRAGYRYFGTLCFACKRLMVSHSITSDSEYKVGSSFEDRAYLCAAETMENCRSLMCAPCWREKFSEEARPKRQTTKVIKYL